MDVTESQERWLVLVQRLPGGAGSARVRVWRLLRRGGAVALRDGTYILPNRLEQRVRFEDAVGLVEAAGGSATLLRVTRMENLSDGEVEALFNEARDQDYRGLKPELDELAQQIREAEGRGDRVELDRLQLRLASLRESWRTIREVDFFEAQAGLELARRMDELDRLIEAAVSPDEPVAESSAAPRMLDPADFRGRLWVTRRGPWIDRLASAWLIGRFIDPEARFDFINPAEEPVPERGITFDMQGGEFTHRGDWVTFETLMHEFGLAGVPGLDRVAAVVHDLDLKRPAPPAEAEGLVRLLLGARLTCDGDHSLVRTAAHLFDLLYESARSAAQNNEKH